MLRIPLEYDPGDVYLHSLELHHFTFAQPVRLICLRKEERKFMGLDPLLEKAIAEAYASAPQDEIPMHSLEVNHFTFTDPVRVIRWSEASPEPRRFRCLLEEDAPYNPGQMVEYIAAPFEIILPEKSTESPGQFSVRVDNIGDLLDEYLENAALSGGPITAIYRSFLLGQEADGPAEVWPGIALHSPRMEGQTLVMDGAVLDWLFRAVGNLYLPGDYPGIIAGR